MKWRDLSRLVGGASGCEGMAVEFHGDVEGQETCIDTGMRGRVVGVSSDDGGLMRVLVSLSEFDSFNQPFERPDYYDKDGNPTLTARQAGCFPSNGIETLYVSADDDIALICRPVDSGSAALMTEFLASGARSYVQWLEAQLNVAREPKEAPNDGPGC